MRRVDAVPHQYNARRFHGTEVCPGVSDRQISRTNRREQAQNVSHLLRSDILPVGIMTLHRVPRRAKRSAVRLNSSNVVLKFVGVVFGISLTAGKPVLLVGPQHHANRPFGSHAQTTQHVDRFHGGDTPTAVVVRTLAYVP